jgi:hypothetical protein
MSVIEEEGIINVIENMSKISIRSIVQRGLAWGVCIFAACIPFQTRFIVQQGTLGGEPWEYATVSVYALEILLLLLFAGALVLHLIDFDDDIHFRNQTSILILILLVLFAVMGVVSAFMAPDRQVGVVAALRLIEGVGLVFLLFHTRFSLHRLALLVSVSAVVQSVLGVYQVITQKVTASTLLGVSEKLPQTPGVSVIFTEGERFLRAYGTFDHPNIYAAYIVIGIFMVLGVLFTHHSTRLERIYAQSALALMSMGLFVGFSRSAYLSLFVGGVVLVGYLWTNKNTSLRNTFAQSIGIGFLVTLVMCFVYAPHIQARYMSTDVLESSSVTERIDLYTNAQQLVEKHWHQGIGIGNYTVAVAQENPELTGYTNQPVHNVYMLMIVELGIAGIFVFMLLLYESIKQLLHFKIEYTQEILEELEKYEISDIYEQEYAFSTHWYIVFASLLFGFLLWMFFDHFFWTLVPGIMMFWFIFGLWVRQFVLVKR